MDCLLFCRYLFKVPVSKWMCSFVWLMPTWWWRRERRERAMTNDARPNNLSWWWRRERRERAMTNDARPNNLFILARERHNSVCIMAEFNNVDTEETLLLPESKNGGAPTQKRLYFCRNRRMAARPLPLKRRPPARSHCVPASHSIEPSPFYSNLPIPKTMTEQFSFSAKCWLF